MRLSLLFVTGFLATAVVACTSTPVAQQPSPIATPTATALPKAKPQSTPANRPDPFQRGLDRASSAQALGRSAQSQDDWRLASTRWQQAVDLMSAVPNSSPHYARAQRKLPEYRQNLAIARQQASRAVPVTNPPVAIAAAPQADPVAVNRPPDPAPPSLSGAEGVHRAPIVRRAGGTPVIRVTFNGGQQYEMIVDTGASGTLITQPMAAALGVVPVGQARVNTASAQNVVFPLGYVRSIEVDGVRANNVLVAVAGSELPIGLLGHDFFGEFDVTIRASEVEFRRR